MYIVLIDEETEENFKNINAIHIDRIEEDEEALIKKERELMKTLFLLQQKHKDINLAYENVMENMKNLIAYQDENINPNHEELKEEEKNTEDNSHFVGGETVDVNANEGEQQGEEAENKEPEEEKNAEPVENAENAVNEEQKVEEGEKKENDDINNNADTIANINTNEETVPQQQETEVVVEETPEETELINKYHTFLKQALKTFNILFLCHSKQEFLNLMNEKGMEMQLEKEKMERMQLEGKKKGRRSTRKRLTNTGSNVFQKPSAPLGAEEEDEDKEIIDKDILNKFMREIKKSREDFVTGDNKQKFAVKK